MHRAGHSAGQEDDGHLCQKGNCLWDPDLISTTGVLMAVLGRKIEGDLQHFVISLPSKVQLAFSTMMISKP